MSKDKITSIEYIANNTYVMNELNKNKLYDYGFRYSKIHSEENYTVYKHTFPVYKHNNRTTLYGEILVSIESGEIVINVYDNTGTPYAPFYHIEYGKYDELQKVMSDNILAKMENISKETGCKIVNLSSNTMM